MVERAPFEQHLSGLDVNFLEDTLHNPTNALPHIPRTHVELSLLVDGHQGRFAIVDQLELVHIARRHATAGLHRAHDAILVIHDNAMATTVSFLLVSLEKAEVIFSFVATDV